MNKAIILKFYTLKFVFIILTIHDIIFKNKHIKIYLIFIII